jgi:hypothetical protein
VFVLCDWVFRVPVSGVSAEGEDALVVAPVVTAGVGQVGEPMAAECAGDEVADGGVGVRLVSRADAPGAPPFGGASCEEPVLLRPLSRGPARTWWDRGRARCVLPGSPPAGTSREDSLISPGRPWGRSGTAPAAPGDAASRRSPERVGCSRPPRHHPDQAALSFTALLRQDGGEGRSPPLEQRSLSFARQRRSAAVSQRPSNSAASPTSQPLHAASPAMPLAPWPPSGSCQHERTRHHTAMPPAQGATAFGW